MLPVVFPSSAQLWLFCLAALVLLAIPGPAVLYIVVQSAEQGRRAGLASVAGVHVGTLVHVAAASIGLSALIVASATAFTAVKYAGAAYLVLLGARKLVGRSSDEQPPRPPDALRRAFVRGAIVNVLNPKTALFFLAFLPQFVDAGRGGVWSQALVLGLARHAALRVIAGSHRALIWSGIRQPDLDLAGKAERSEITAPGFDDQPGLHAQALANQMGVDRRGRHREPRADLLRAARVAGQPPRRLRRRTSPAERHGRKH